MLTSAPSTRNSTRLTEPLSLAVAASVTARATGELLAAGGAGQAHAGRRVGRAVRAAVAGRAIQRERRGRVVSPAERAVESGGESCHRWRCSVFQSALLATVICALPAGWVKETGQPFCRRCPFGKLKISVQPLVMAGTVVGDDDVGAEAVAAFPGSWCK